MLSTKRFRATMNNSWKCIRDIKGKYPSRSLSFPRAWLCLPSSAVQTSLQSTAAHSRGWRAAWHKSPALRWEKGKDELETHSQMLTSTSLSSCVVSLWGFSAYHFLQKGAETVFYDTTVKMVVFKKQIHLINIPCFILTWSNFEIIGSNCYWHLFDVMQQKEEILKL